MTKCAALVIVGVSKQDSGHPPPQVAYYLNKYLGQYVYNVDASALNISILKGDVELKNLQLKPEALNSLNLPITVKSGLLGSLRLKVWPLLSTPIQQ